MDVEIHPRAYDHGVSRDDMLHVYNYPGYFAMTDDPDVIMYVGWTPGGVPLEVAAVETADRYAIIHAMPARPKNLPKEGKPRP